MWWPLYKRLSGIQDAGSKAEDLYGSKNPSKKKESTYMEEQDQNTKKIDELQEMDTDARRQESKRKWEEQKRKPKRRKFVNLVGWGEPEDELSNHQEVPEGWKTGVTAGVDKKVIESRIGLIRRVCWGEKHQAWKRRSVMRSGRRSLLLNCLVQCCKNQCI